MSSPTPQTEVKQPPPAPPKSQYQVLTLAEIRESKTNPRRNFDKKKLEELTSSIRQHGVLEPLLVRPATNAKSPVSFEIIAGARRYRAAQAAHCTTVPAIVKEATDEEVLEMQVVENQQRADLHPLEEAHGYAALMAPPHRQKAAQIAERVGKSEKYVYDRVKLLDLIKPLQEVFWADEITAGHAILLARESKEDQKRILEDPTDGLFYEEHRLIDPEIPYEDQPHGRRAISVRELQAVIDRTCRFTPKDAIQNPLVYPETAETLQSLIEPDGKTVDAKVLPITYEHVLRDSARDTARTFGPRSWVRADGQYKTKTCEHSEMGLVVAGPRRGEAFHVCRAKDKCTVHYGKEIRAKQRAATDAKAQARAEKDEKTHLARQRREALAREREEEKREIWKKAVPDILAAVRERVLKMPTKVGSWLACQIMAEIERSGRQPDLKTPGTGADDVVRQAAFAILAQDASNEFWAPDRFPSKAKAMGIDLKAILAAHAPKPEKPAPAKKAKEAKKG